MGTGRQRERERNRPEKDPEIEGETHEIHTHDRSRGTEGPSSPPTPEQRLRVLGESRTKAGGRDLDKTNTELLIKGKLRQGASGPKEKTGGGPES